MTRKIKRLIVILGLWLCPLILLAKEAPTGILITKSSPDTPNSQASGVVEYSTITEHLIPSTDYVTVTKPDSTQDLIPKNLIIMRVDYPKETSWNIFSDSMIGTVISKVQELQQLVQKYPVTQKYLNPRIVPLQQEVDLYNQGEKKLNGTWISANDFDSLLTIERQRRAEVAAAQKKAADEAAAAARKQEEQIEAEAKREADEEAAAVAKQKAQQQAAAAKVKEIADLAKRKKDAEALEKLRNAKGATNVPWTSIILGAVAAAGLVAGFKYLKAKSGIKSISSLDWQKFELLVAEVYRRQGYSVEISAGFGTEDGVDVVLTRREDVILVQCKHWKALKNYKVSGREIQKLSDAVAEAPGRQGIFVSTGEYTKEARTFVEDKPISLLGPSDIEQMIPNVQRRNENIYNFQLWINEFIDSAKIVDPICPKCQKPMVLKRARGGAPIWRCPDSQVCSGKLDGRADLLVRREF